MRQAIEIKITENDWRVRWPDYGVNKDVMRKWCRDNCRGSFYIFMSHVRFKDETDAHLCFLTFG